MAEKAPEGRELEWSVFVVDSKPVALWGDDLARQNRTFLEGIDPTFFTYTVETHLPGLEGASRQHAAVAIRLAYAQALGTMFALLCAAVQAPHCPLGWVLSYKPEQVREVVRKIHYGEEGLLTRHSEPVTWDSLSGIVHSVMRADPAESERIRALFAENWAMLAHDLLSEYAHEEYNSLKHGFCARPGGFELNLYPTAPGAKPIESRSEFGTRFFWEERIGGNKTNYYANDAMRNWNPIALAVRVELISASIANVVSYLRTVVKGGPSSVTLQIPAPDQSEALQLAWKADYLFEAGRESTPVALAPNEFQTANDVLGAYHNNRKRRPLEPPSDSGSGGGT